MAIVHLLGNPVTSTGRASLDEVAGAFDRRGVQVSLLAGDNPDAARRSAHEVAARGGARIVAVGGDGAVHLAVNAVAETDAVLGVVPNGTGNDFARALGLLGGDLDSQVDTALSEPSAVDAIRSTHGWVASVATLGFSGDVTARANALRWPRGEHRYTLATVLQLPRLRTLDVGVQVDGRPVGGRTTLLAIGNTGYFGGGMLVCPEARPDDGLLQVVNIGAVPRLRFLRLFPRVFSGRHVDRREVTVGRGAVATVDGDGIDLWADGERLGPLPVTLEVVPGALRVAR